MRSRTYFAKRIGLVSAAVVAAWVIYLLVEMFLRAQLVVVVNTPSLLTIRHIDSSDIIISESVDSELTRKLRRGTYIVEASTATESTKTVVELGIRENKSIELDINPSASVLQSTTMPALSVGIIESDLYYLDDATGSLQSVKNRSIASQDIGGEIRQAFFADDGSSHLLVDNFGFGFLVAGANTLEIRGDTGDASLSDEEDEGGSIVSADYDEARKQFCVLFSDRTIHWYDIQGSARRINIENSANLDKIDCSNGVAMVSQLGDIFDGPTNKKINRSRLLVIDQNNKVESVNTDSLVDMKVANSEGELVWIDNRKIFSANTTNINDKTIVGTAITTNSDSLQRAGSEVYLFDEEEVWRIAIDRRTMYRVATSFNSRAISGFAADGRNLYYSTSRGLDTGVFAIVNDPEIVALYRRLSSQLPLIGNDYRMTLGFDGEKIVLKVTITAPLPSSGDLTLYSQALESARSKIAEFNAPVSLITITVD